MNILVAGGAGYIGSVNIEKLLSAGHEVVVYDNLSTGHREAVHPDSLFIEGDLGDKDKLDSLFRQHKIDAVMHFAAFIQVGESMKDPARYFTNNVGNVINLLNVMLAHDVKKFVFRSTAAVYGEPEEVPITELAPERPTNPYGECKLMVERILRWYDALIGLRYVSLRYFNAAGASESYGEDHSPETHLIPIVIKVALGQQQRLMINGADYPTPDGTCIRDYIHILDLAQAHLLALKRLEEGSGVYNLGNGNGYSVKEVVDAVKRVTGKPIEIMIGPRRPGDAISLVASAEKAKRGLGWNPRFTDLDSIIESAWKWHSKYPHGYRK